MPFVMVHALEHAIEQKRALVKGVTEATCAAYDVPPATVTVYIQDYADGNYGHAGELGPNAVEQRAFIQIHALPRPAKQKRQLVKEITHAIVSAYGVPAGSVVVYIFDSEKTDCAHGGILIGDSENG